MDFQIYDISIIPVIIALVELFKKMGLHPKWAPIPAMIFGVVAGVVYVTPECLQAGIFYGVIIGLSSVGLFSSGKNVKQEADQVKYLQEKKKTH